jgi:hypothetical protein
MYILIKTFPEVLELYRSNDPNEINNFILQNIPNFKNHNTHWIVEHCEQKDRHIMEYFDGENCLTECYFVIKLRLKSDTTKKNIKVKTTSILMPVV